VIYFPGNIKCQGVYPPVSPSLEYHVKGDTPLNPRSKGVPPLWIPQKGKRGGGFSPARVGRQKQGLREAKSPCNIPSPLLKERGIEGVR